MAEERVVKRRRKRGLSPTHVFCKQKTFWLDNEVNEYLNQLTSNLGISQNYFINSVLRQFKSGELSWDNIDVSQVYAEDDARIRERNIEHKPEEEK